MRITLIDLFFFGVIVLLFTTIIIFVGSLRKRQATMQLKSALDIAVKCIDLEIKRLAVDANMRDVYKADYPSAIHASERRLQLIEARRLIHQHTITLTLRKES